MENSKEKMYCDAGDDEYPDYDTGDFETSDDDDWEGTDAEPGDYWPDED